MFDTKRLYEVLEALHQETCAEGGQNFKHSTAWQNGMVALTELDSLLFHVGGTGSFDQTDEALAQVPPGRTLAGEYLRLHRACTEQQKQIVRAIELRIEADKRAGRRNVLKMRARVESLEFQLEKLGKQRDVLADALKAAPWGSCRDLSEAAQDAIRENEAHDVKDELAELLDVGLDPSRLQEGTIVHVTTEGHPLPRLGKIVAIDSTQFHMFEVEILATRERESFAACFLEPA